MVFLVHKLGFPHHHHHNNHHAKPFLVSIQAFRSNVSNCLTKLLLNSDPGSEFLSIIWLKECLEVLHIVNKAFVKLAAEIDYPMTKWKVSRMEEYLDYSLSLLDSLNSISFALSRLSQARISLSHASSLTESFAADKSRPLNEIEYKIFRIDEKVDGIGERKEKSLCGKELALHEALLVLKSIGSWTCSVVISGICSDVEPYLKMRRSAELHILPPLVALDSLVYKKVLKNRELVKEIKDVNDALQCHVSADNSETHDRAKELQRRLEAIEKAQTAIEGVVNLMFSDVLIVRNELINTLGQRKL